MFEQAAESGAWPTVETCRVLQLSATGLATAEVAAAMQLSIGTVLEHIAQAIIALSAGSKLEAVVIALQLGIIELPSVRLSPSAPGVSSTTSPWSCSG